MDTKYDEQILKSAAQLIGEITYQREKQGISQKQLADLAGVKQSAISRMESLKALPQIDTLLKIIAPLNLKLTVQQKNLVKENNMNITSKNVKRLEVDTYSCQLYITRSVDDEFHLVTDNENSFTFETTDDAIKIKQKKKNVLKWLFNWASVNLKITVPADFSGEVYLSNQNGGTNLYSISLDRISVKSGNGSIMCEDINAGELRISNGNGRVELQGANVKSFDGSSGNGRIKLSEFKCEGFLRAKTGNGRLVIKNTTAESMDLKSSNGAIVITGADASSLTANTGNGKIIAAMRGDKADYSIDFATSIGGIYIGGEKHSGRYILKGGDSRLDAHTSVGSIRFKFADTVCKDEEFDDILKEEIDALSPDVEDIVPDEIKEDKNNTPPKTVEIVEDKK